jgi:hypothetical protein
MFKLYYTGAKNSLGEQSNPQLSLGGHISSTEVTDDFLNNIFSDISLGDLTEGSHDTKVLALKNETGKKVSNLKIYTIAPRETKISLGFVKPTMNSCQEPMFEKLNSSKAQARIKLFEANAEYESCVIEINRAPVKNDQLIISDNGVIVDQIVFNTNNSVDNYLDHIISRFDNESYSIEKIANNALKLTKNLVGQNEGGLIEFKIGGQIIAPSQNLVGLIDNSVIIETIENQEIIGLFIRRSTQIIEAIDALNPEIKIEFILDF